MKTIYEKFFACILLGIIGDKIGFENGDREFFLLEHIPKYTSPDFKKQVEAFTAEIIKSIPKTT